MDGKPNNPREMDDHELDQAIHLDAAEDADGLSIRNQHLAKIQECEEAALARRDPFSAVGGLGATYLQQIYLHLGHAVVDTLESGSGSLEEIRDLKSEIGLLVKLRKSIETDIALHHRELEQETIALPRTRHGEHRDPQRADPFRRGLPRK